MDDELIGRVIAAIERAGAERPAGRVTGAAGAVIEAEGLLPMARLGSRVTIRHGAGRIAAEVVRIAEGRVQLLPEGSAEGVTLGDLVQMEPAPVFAPDDSWIGRVVDPDGAPLDGLPLLPGARPRRLQAAPPPPQARRPMGSRLSTGLAVFNTLLPLVQGQRIGLFAGSGVGKSTLLADLARGVGADVIVIGLVGERGRELRHFVQEVLGPEGMARAVVVAATSDRAPQTRRRCALAATAVAEHFRDEGRQVLLLIDSVTRFAEAHREVAAAAGEPAALRGFPASTAPAIAALCERAGPGTEGQGDITAIYSVLVAGSDMDEPVADWLRGVLDGHVVMDRAIAERGRFPAVDLLRSVSRSLPAAATAAENQLIGEARGHLGAYARAELMIQAGLYTAGSDPAVDAAITCHGALDAFLARKGDPAISSSFTVLRQVLAQARAPARRKD
ncbi:FliI/YscN family ATPase [Pseudoroseicyclus aestuarii]|uniref:Flagellum-specific ATP synthase n=1 Tax=Pseudoroseicyclus aestuarii TaxID=1795041 RepID=A0A318SW44_9RHOB|nr:FliI/YscN family ATPase [Pseudoroseicyclus aestuarii]PYE84576.1 flagellum-specific ATP synthase [Pseudoroseicyclus aestuarii]